MSHALDVSLCKCMKQDKCVNLKYGRSWTFCEYPSFNLRRHIRTAQVVQARHLRHPYSEFLQLQGKPEHFLVRVNIANRANNTRRCSTTRCNGSLTKYFIRELQLETILQARGRKHGIYILTTLRVQVSLQGNEPTKTRFVEIRDG